MEMSWCEMRLEEIADIYDGPHATPEKTNSGPIFLGISNIINGRLNLSEVEHLSEENFQRWTRRVTPTHNDVVFSYETKLGEAALIPPQIRCCLGRRMGLLRAHSHKVDSRFLLYAYLGNDFQEILRERTIHGSTVDRIPLIEMPKFPIKIPKSLSEQRAIAHILGTLDDKIELNRQMNATLEEMARALFKSWFVDFDPVRAKAAGRAPVGMDAETAALFPDSFQDSELGEIPMGWEVNAVYDFAEYVNGSAFRSTQFSPTGVGLPIVKIGELKAGITNQTKFTEESMDRRILITSGDILFSWSGSPDTSIDIFLWSGKDGWLNQHIFKINTKDNYKIFVYFMLKYFKSTFIEIARDKQTTGLGHVTVQDLKRLKCVHPSIQLLNAFDKKMSPIFQKFYTNEQETQTLTSLRDTLLPKLISGEVRVKDAEGFLKDRGL